ncbi:MAG: FAD-dependent oxidoreductase, partial [Candidatus Hydrogenedentes bacterium]|nr:FAD-dependent oxidoreductase [Candidatus Hydrogenedentota bacterium]
MVYRRDTPPYADKTGRVKHYDEFLTDFDDRAMAEQGYRCMNCGVPFCQSGCPLGNIIPDFNDLVKDQKWGEALDRLHSTNNFPEFTGRVCPAPCEASCVLGINEPAVTIKLIERSIADHGFEDGRIAPQPAEKKTGKKIAVIGSGPAGLAAAQQLCRAGHDVTVYERADEAGGLLLYGIPDFKLNKDIVRRRLRQMEAEGVTFKCGVEVG